APRLPRCRPAGGSRRGSCAAIPPSPQRRWRARDCSTWPRGTTGKSAKPRKRRTRRRGGSGRVGLGSSRQLNDETGAAALAVLVPEIAFVTREDLLGQRQAEPAGQAAGRIRVGQARERLEQLV